MSKFQKYAGIATILLVAFSVPSFADSACVGGSYASLEGTSCAIGGTTFSFSSTTLSGGVSASSLILTPESTTTTAGFNISEAVPDALSAAGNATYLIADFTAVPTTSFTSFTTDLNGVTQAINSYSLSELEDPNTGAYAFTAIQNGVEAGVPGSAEPSFNGSFELYNSGSADFSSADFTFNEVAAGDSPPTSVPEGSELGMVGVAIVGLFGALKRKFFLAAK
jgi:hypothetical protein